MANRYHVNPETGEAKPCTAEIQCRFGGDTPHFDTKEEAQAAAETLMSEKFGATQPLKKSTKKIKKTGEKIGVYGWRDTAKLNSITGVRFDEENNNVRISVQAADLYDSRLTPLRGSSVSVEELREMYPEQVENDLGLYEPDFAAAYILGEEENRLNEPLSEEELEEFRRIFLASEQVDFETAYLNDTVSINGDEDTTFSIEFSNLNAAEYNLAEKIERYREEVENERIDAELERKREEHQEQLKNASNDYDQPVSENEIRRVSDNLREFLSAELDTTSNRVKVEFDVDDYIEERNKGYWNEELYYGEPTDYEGAYSWKEDEDGDWEIEFNEEEIKKRADWAIEDWEETTSSMLHDQLSEVGIKNLLRFERVHQQGNGYSGAYHRDDRAEADEKYDEMLNREIDIDYSLKNDYWSVEHEAQAIKEWLQSTTNPETGDEGYRWEAD